MKKDTTILIRVSQDEKEGFEQAAEHADLKLSAWMRQRLKALAVSELALVGEKPAFLKPTKTKGKK